MMVVVESRRYVPHEKPDSSCRALTVIAVHASNDTRRVTIACAPHIGSRGPIDRFTVTLPNGFGFAYIPLLWPRVGEKSC